MSPGSQGFTRSFSHPPGGRVPSWAQSYQGARRDAAGPLADPVRGSRRETGQPASFAASAASASTASACAASAPAVATSAAAGTFTTGPVAAA
jgi:hypothetical protein